MVTFYLFLFLLSGICFGLSVGHPTHWARWMAAGLLLWVAVHFLQTLQQL